MKMIAQKNTSSGLIGLLAACLFLLTVPAPSLADQQRPLHILCTTFPVHLIARNLVQGREGVVVESLLPAQLGCPHDYTLTPQDMQRISQADVVVMNGLGLEDFLTPQLLASQPAKAVIDSSEGITDTMPYAENKEQAHEDHQTHGVNPHLFTSPRLSARMAATIASELALIDPLGADIYRRNGQHYAKRMTALEQRTATVGKRLAKRRIITLHGVFDYLARDLGLEVVAVVQVHPGQEPSAAEMLTLIKTARDSRAGAIFSEPQYPAKVVQAIAREAGIPAATLDPAASGPEGAGLDYFERVMSRNLEVLQQTLGTMPDGPGSAPLPVQSSALFSR